MFEVRNLEMALEMIKSETLDSHNSHDCLWGGLCMRTLSIKNKNDKIRMIRNKSLRKDTYGDQICVTEDQKEKMIIYVLMSMIDWSKERRKKK